MVDHDQLLIQALRKVEKDTIDRMVESFAASLPDHGAALDIGSLRTTLGAVHALWLDGDGRAAEGGDLVHDLAGRLGRRGVPLQAVLHAVARAVHVAHGALDAQVRLLTPAEGLQAAVVDRLRQRLHDAQAVIFGRVVTGHASRESAASARTPRDLLARIVTTEIRDEGWLIERGLRLGVNLRTTSFGFLLVPTTATGDGGAESIRQRLAGAVSFPGADCRVDHTVIAVPDHSEQPWISVRDVTKRMLIARSGLIVASEVGVEPEGMRGAYRDALTLLPIAGKIARLSGSGFVDVTDHLDFLFVATSDPRARHRYIVPTLGDDLMAMSARERSDELMDVLALHLSGADIQRAQHVLNMGERTYREHRSRLQALTGLQPKEGRLYLAALINELEALAEEPGGTDVGSGVWTNDGSSRAGRPAPDLNRPDSLAIGSRHVLLSRREMLRRHIVLRAFEPRRIRAMGYRRWTTMSLREVGGGGWHGRGSDCLGSARGTRPGSWWVTCAGCCEP